MPRNPDKVLDYRERYDYKNQDDATKYALDILYAKNFNRDKRGVGKWLFIPMPFAVACAYYFDWNKGQIKLMTWTLVLMILSLRGPELIIRILLNRGWLDVKSPWVRIVSNNTYIAAFLAGFIIWAATYFAFFNFHY